MLTMNEQFAGFFKSFQPTNDQFTNAFKNMFFGNEQFLNAVRTGIETQVAFLTTLSTTVFDSTNKVVELNMRAAKTSVDESTVIASQLLASRNPQEAMQLVAALPQPSATKALAYSRHLADIASATQAELTRATQEQIAESVRKFTALVDEATKNAPPGSESAVAMMKSAIANTSAGYEQMTRTTKQAAEVVQASVAASVDQVSRAAEQAATASGRAHK